MQAVILTSIVILSQNVLANTILSCSTSGFALSEMNVIQRADGSGVISAKISEEEDAPTFDYVINSGIKDLMTPGASATLIAQKNGKHQEGGAFDDAVLLRVLEGQKKAILAMNGVVYRLYCY